MNMNKSSIDRFREDFKHAVAELEDRYDVEINLGSISYNNMKFNGKITVQNKCSEKEMFEMQCRQNNFTPEDYNRPFLSGGNEYNLIGFDIAARKYTCIGKRKDNGLRMRFAPYYVKQQFI